MASLVNPFNINGNYPIAGQDNDSQGFRDNFTNIKNNFIFIKQEVEDMQSKVILKSALSGSSLDNNFLGSQVKNIQTKNQKAVKQVNKQQYHQLSIIWNKNLNLWKIVW